MDIEDKMIDLKIVENCTAAVNNIKKIMIERNKKKNKDQQML